jgi:hypothetical protein
VESTGGRLCPQVESTGDTREYQGNSKSDRSHATSHNAPP